LPHEDAVQAHRLDDILEVMFADVDELDVDFAVYLTKGILRYTYASGLGDALDPRSDIYAIAVDIVRIDNHVDEINPDPERDALDRGYPGIALDHCQLNLRGTTNRVDYTQKLRQKTVAGVLHNPPAMLQNFWIDELTEVYLEAFVRPFLIRPISRE
jgi:hypothetical protein